MVLGFEAGVYLFDVFESRYIIIFIIIALFQVDQIIFIAHIKFYFIFLFYRLDRGGAEHGRCRLLDDLGVGLVADVEFEVDAAEALVCRYRACRGLVGLLLQGGGVGAVDAGAAGRVQLTLIELRDVDTVAHLIWLDFGPILGAVDLVEGPRILEADLAVLGAQLDVYGVNG